MEEINLNHVNITIILFLLVLLITICLTYLLDRLILSSYKSHMMVSGDLREILQRFCDKESLAEPRLITSHSFLYRPLVNTVGIRKLDSYELVDTLAFVHGLYHYKDRERVLRFQIVISIYTYLISLLLKLLTLYFMFFGKIYRVFVILIAVDIVMLLICLILTLMIEQYASREAVVFLEVNQYVDDDSVVRKLSFYAIMTYVFQFLIYIITSMLLLYLII